MESEMINDAVYLKEFGGPDQLTIKTSSLPAVDANHARIEIVVSTVSTTDRIIRKGMFPPLNKRPPFILGYDFTGKVVELGSNVKGFKEGDWVTGIPMTGCYATFIDVDPDSMIKIPAIEDAASAAPITLFYLPAYQMLEHCADLKEGDKILIQAATGSVGQALLQLGKLKKLDMVGTGSESKLENITMHGAKALNYNSKNYKRELKDLAGRGFDAAFDCTNHYNLNLSYKLLSKEGVLVNYGLFNKSTTVEKRTVMKFIYFIANFVRLIAKLKFWNLGKKSAFFYDIQTEMTKRKGQFQEDLNTLHRYLKSGQILPNIQNKFKLSDAAKAHEELDKNTKTGYIVILDRQ
ncbi:MAG: zinc-binding dehydrogenase [Flavobacteriales bacterium]|nr:zinc-binding dehydrogenase [Flavobacteriales bacterium]